MASISKDKRGNIRILYTAPDGTRKSVYLGKASKRIREGVKFRLESIVAAQRSGQGVDADTAEWIANLKPELADKFAAVGLIHKRDAEMFTRLGSFLDAYIDGRNDLKRSTLLVRGLAIKDLKEFFGADRDVGTITGGDADDFKQWLIGKRLANSTIHKRLQVCRSFFHAMRRRKLIAENPFDGVKTAATGIKNRLRFVTRDEIGRVLDACPDHNWRLIVALARYGGLRCPSEVLSLRWQDINWEASRMIVASPKTEHHEDKASRVVPIFPELKPYLEKSFYNAPDGAEYVIDARYREAALKAGGWANANLRTTLLKIIKRAGLKPWPRLFQNLRASRETELVESFPVQCVTDWIGNSPKVAMANYLMTTDAHFERAIQGNAETTRIPTQSSTAMCRETPLPKVAAQKKTPVFQGFTESHGFPRNAKVAEAGLEPATRGL